MSEDPASVWRNQPEETRHVQVQPFIERRTRDLSSGTRAEIAMSLAAAIFFVAVASWRLAPVQERAVPLGLAALTVWVLVSLYHFRHRILGRHVAAPDAFAITGVEHYRRELERRRDHLRNSWLWHGPLVLACLTLAATVFEAASASRLRNALPLVLVLALWTGLGISRRRRQANAIQREIDDLSAEAS